MLRSLGKNAVVNRTQFSFRDHVKTTGSAYTSCGYRSLQERTSLRSLSTIPSSPTTKPSSDHPNVPPPHLPPRKAKIDLKPSPIKPTTNKVHSPSQKQSQPNPHPKDNSLPTLKVNLVPKPPSPQSSVSVVELAKQDIAHATALGVLSPPAENAGAIKRFAHQAIQLFKFYFRGLKAINTHRRQASVIRARASSGGALPSRAELRFIRTFNQDALKLIPFVIIVLVAEEIIPFIALYVPKMLPSTCILPGQRDRIAAKTAEKQSAAISAHPRVFEALKKEGQTQGFVPLRNVDNPAALCGMLGLSSWGPTALAAWRIRRHIQYIASDDDALRQEGYGRDLTQFELVEALRERGILGDNLSLDDLISNLKWWLNTTGSTTQGDEVSRRILALGVAGTHY
ncbi:hypothetical protein BJ138DRAFT_1059668 [Hygrophoropsis aurantiaca]|uniref:Uncharacterized protein n=1 Tax=Hygrophoropsis aurantiaca TaxID=72124 RepID=A0ACB8AI98_9AGAM|nr:hypothetical protein BJ138DRAFT_1059668 [Hygrophoropsis aurantiaca]